MIAKKSRISRLLDRAAERLSLQVFLLGLICAVFIEIGIDWNATLYEINVLRDSLRQRGENYADILRKAAEAPLLGYDWEDLDRISSGLFDDEDVIYVRFSDVLGNILYDRLRPEYGRAFRNAHKESFRAHYRKVMERDTRGMLILTRARKRKS